MMKGEFLRKLKKSNGIRFILYPIVFFILSCLIFMIALGPIVMPMLDVLDIVTLSEPPTFDEPARKLDFTAEPSGKIVVPSEGEEYGKIVIETAKIDAPLYYGDNTKILRKGVGTYMGTYIPGQRRTILLAAHNNRHFHTLGKAKVGDKVEITTSYGNYVYEITGSKVALATDTTAYDLTKEEENLIMYTCYPFDTLGYKPQRYFVYAKYVSGPQVPEETGGNG